VSESVTADLCVIGAGSGGLVVTAVAAQLGFKTVLLESRVMGGDCLNFGCVPSKALLAAAKRMKAAGENAAFGLKGVPLEVDFPAVMDHVHRVISAIEPNDSQPRFEGMGARVIRAHGRFVGPDEVEAEGVRIKARRIVIASGSTPTVPAVPGLENVPFLTNETLFENRVLPRHLVVLGGGPVGIEMAQAHRLLGSQVTVLEALPLMLPHDDPELTTLLAERLAADGVDIRTGAKVRRIEREGDGLAVIFGAEASEERLLASHLLVATGRRPNLDDLDVEKAGIERDEKGGLRLDRRLRTTNRRIFAIGDAAGGPQFTHAASYQAGIVIRNVLFRLPSKVDYRALPAVTYTEPELAQVGLSEAAAVERFGPDLRILRWPLHENDRGQAERQTHGLIKVLTRRNGRILGAAILAPSAGELIQPWVLALGSGLKIAAFAGMIAPYPTLGEIGKRVASRYYLPKLMNERTKSLLKWLRWLG